MAYTIRKSGDRKFFDHGWLKTLHTFSFGSYYDPNWMGFRDLRVINEDRVAPGHGFPPHDHRDMEIISIVLEGELAHQDSMETQSVIHANEIQTMSAGTGVTHSEYNPSNSSLVHFLQIWIIPDKKGLKPRYQQMALSTSSDQWHLIASKNGPLIIEQDVALYMLSLESGTELEKEMHNRYGWLQVISGELAFEEAILQAGDGVAMEDQTSFRIKAQQPSRLLFFDLK